MMTSGTVLLVACSTEDLQITTRAVPTPQIPTPWRVATTSVQVRESQTENAGALALSPSESSVDNRSPRVTSDDSKSLSTLLLLE